MNNQLAVISVIYENYLVLKDFLRGFQKQTNTSFKVFLSDLSTNKQSLPKQSFSCSTIFSQNRGYSHGINIALNLAIQEGFHSFCIINNDTYFKSDFVGNVLKSITHHPYSLIGGKIYYAPGYEFHKTRYQKKDRGNVLWYAGGSVDWNHALTPHKGVDQIDKGQYGQFERTDFVNGCLMLFDKSVIDSVGLWDESYFLYFEDADYCERAKLKGISLYYDPSLVIWHKNAQSTGGSGSKTHVKYQEKNRLRFALKYAPLKTKLHLLKNFFFNGLR